MWCTLSARIRWLVLWATLPAALLVVHQARAHHTDAIASAEERALQTLQSVVGTRQRLNQNTRQFLQQLAAMPQVHGPSAPPVRALPGRSAVAQHHLRQHWCASGGR